MKTVIRKLAKCLIGEQYQMIWDAISRNATTIERQNHRIKALETALTFMVNSPVYQSAEEIGFNGQMARKRCFERMLSIIRFDALVETGTWMGNTTGYLREKSGLPVYSTEISPTYHHTAKARLKQLNQIELFNLDAVRFLRALPAAGLAREQTLFFYLDAHWYDYLPLRDEIELIANQWDEFVVLIDDFEVPGDAGYKFDDYGPKTGRLDLALIADLPGAYDMDIHFPATPATEESGRKCGWVVLSRGASVSSKLDSISMLKSHQIARAPKTASEV